MVKRTEQREKFDLEKKADVEAGRGGRGRSRGRGGRGGRGGGRGGKAAKKGGGSGRGQKMEDDKDEDDASVQSGDDESTGDAAADAHTVRYSPAGEGCSKGSPKQRAKPKAKPGPKAKAKVKAKAAAKANLAKRKPGRPKKAETCVRSESEAAEQSPPSKRAKVKPDKEAEVQAQESEVRKTFAGRRRGQGEVARARFDVIQRVFAELVAPSLSTPSKFEVLLAGLMM